MAPAPSFPSKLTGLCAVLPALDEEATVGDVVRDLLRRGVPAVVVADNGSADRTAACARDAGAIVVAAERRGYGAACLAALRAVPPGTRAVVFCDADGQCDLDDLVDVCGPVLLGERDLVVGSRTLGPRERGALTLPQRFGNVLAAALLRRFFAARVSDLGPFRCVSAATLALIDMRDQTFGWTVEMQCKVLQRGLRYAEVPVRARARQGGRSKISGDLRACVRAGRVILATIWRHRRRVTAALAAARPAAPEVRS